MNTSIVALAGSPNSGKTALFNALTGTHQKIGNYPGTTVEKKVGTLRYNKKEISIIDLPGTYSLEPQTLDEKVALNVLLNQYSEKPEVIICVADSTNLERSLYVVMELKELGKKIVLALNMMDLAEKKNCRIDLCELEKELGVDVVPTVAVKNRGIKEILNKVGSYLENPTPQNELQWQPSTSEDVKRRFIQIDKILKKCVSQGVNVNTWTEKIDRIVLHPVSGMVFLLGLLFLIFQSVFVLAETPMSWIEQGVEFVKNQVNTLLVPSDIQSLLSDGILSGVGSVLVFLPQILLLFFFILILEDSGYMGRAAVLMDRFMSFMGLPGKSFIPLLSSFACAIPGIMATRTIEDHKSRLTTILIAPLMTCSARLPVYALLIAAFIPNEKWGVFNLQGLILFGLYLMGIVFAIILALVFRKTIVKGRPPSLILELPSYKTPSVRNLVFGLLERTKIFLKRAGTFILVTSRVLWFLASYPKNEKGETSIESSYAGRLGHLIEPLVSPLGFDWRISTGMIPGFAAREVMVSALGTVFAIEEKDEEELTKSLSEKIRAAWSLPTALSLLMWYVFSPQCLSTLAVTRRELNTGWSLFMLIYMLLLAYVSAFLTFQFATWLGI